MSHPDKRFVWFSDIHLNLSMIPFLKRTFALKASLTKPDGVFITGDISTGATLHYDLEFLASTFSCDIYFVLGNHDYHYSSFRTVANTVKTSCEKHKNLRWMTQEDPIKLSEDVAVVGDEGWYDAHSGNSEFLRFTPDWLLTSNFLHFPTHSSRVEAFRSIAAESTERLSKKVLSALEDHKLIYVLTHFPPWAVATRAIGTLFENFWLPYNANSVLGAELEKIASENKKRRIIVLCGHTHTPCHVRLRKNLECIVARANYFGDVRPEESFII